MTDLATALGVEFQTVADLIATYTRRGLTIATAESLTGGLLAAVLTEIPGSSAVVRGGLVVYATDLKQSLAGVDPGLLARQGPVDPRVAMELADGARRTCGAAVGVGLTGVAGPDPQNGIQVGTWFVALAGPGEHRDQRRGVPQDGFDSRASVRSAAVRGALEMLANTAAMDS